MSHLPSKRSDEHAAMRLGSTAAGMLAGLAIGATLGVALLAAGAEAASGWLFFLCIIAGTVAGYLSADIGLGLFEGVTHFFIGVAHGFAERIPTPSEFAPSLLR